MKNKKKILARMEYKRFFQKLRSKYKKKLMNGGKIVKKMVRKLHFKKKATIYKKMKVPHIRKRLTIKVPKIFDLSTEPDSVLQFLNELSKNLHKDIAYDLYIDHSETEAISLDASYLFDSLIKNYSKYWQKLHIKIHMSGTASNNVDVNNFLLSFGLLNELNITKHKLFPDLADRDYIDKYITFKKDGASLKSYLAGNTSTELVNYFDKCFNENGLRIKDNAKSDLMDCFGEIIKNAEEHSGKETTEWIVRGCYTKSTHSCSFSIINYGNSFYQSLTENSSTAKTVLEEISKVIYSHTRFITKLSLNMELYQQAIYTYMAIQDGISSKRSEYGKASTRGQGIIDVVQFIDQIRNKKNSITYLNIISGNTFLNIDYKYPLVVEKKGKNQEIRRLMYLNEKSNFSDPPDIKKLKTMKNYFPGVIFSGYFTIDQDYLLEQVRSA